jgi:UDP:flavonoid glycosyltransferase YjiC (YdhE family)
MFSNFLIILGFLSFIPEVFCLNILLVSIGHAGHVTPLFELAKALKNHDITFLTQPLAKSYVNFNSYPNASSFHVIYTNDSADAVMHDKQKEQQLISYSANHSFFDSMAYTSGLLREDSTSLLNKTVHTLMINRYDVIIVNSLFKWIHVLCKQTNTPCVVQSTEILPNIFELNLPNIYSLLSREQMTQIKYRIYNVIFTLRLVVTFVTKLLPSFGKIANSFPRVPGPFYDSFSMKNLLLSEAKCLELISLAPTFFTPSYTHHYQKYLGAFIDETGIIDEENELTKWVKSKPNKSIIYGAFGTSSLIQFDRMRNLINGLAEFLLKTPDSFLLLVFRGSNYDNYQMVLNKMNNKEYSNLLTNHERVKIENRFVQQKWILQENSIKLFLSHCGMGSSSEGIFFQRPILCMPFNMDQFSNAITIEQSGIGLSLFIPPSLFQSLISPYNFYDYIFSEDSVTMKLSKMWERDSYQQMITIMSMEMKHAGGLKQAVKEIEFFVNLNGNLDRYAPFQSTLRLYQRYMIDLLIIFIILPTAIVFYGFIKCCKRRRKVKKD